MAVVVTNGPKNITFTCRRCGTTFIASYPSWSNTKKGYSCQCPVCPYSVWKSK